MSPAPAPVHYSRDMLDELVARYLKDRDETAIEELVRRTRPRLLAAARRIGASQDAEDSVHAAYLSLLLKTELDAPALPWLLRAVVRIAYRRKARNRRLRDVADRLQRPAEEPGPAAAAMRAEEHAILRRRVAELPATYRDPLVLHYLEGLPTGDVALLLDTTRDAIKKRLERARKLLRAGGSVRLRAYGWLLPWWGGTVMKKKPVMIGVVVAALLGGVAVWRTGLRDAVDRAARGERTAMQPENATSATGEPEAAESAAPNPAVTGPRITGRVLDAEGRGVARAEIIADPWTLDGRIDADDVRAPASRTQSRADGAFVLPVADEPGFCLHVRGDAGQAHVPAARAGEVVEIRLEPWRSFFGRVRNAEGESVPGARVRWLGLQLGLAVERETVSGTDGLYRLDRLPAQGIVARWIEVRADGYAPLFFAQGAHPSRVENELDLVVVKGVTLTGKVVDGATEQPLSGVRVVLWSTEGTRYVRRRRGGASMRNPFAPRSLGETRSNEHGWFSFAHVPGQGFHELDNKPGVIGGAGAFADGYVCAPADVMLGATHVRVVCWPAAEIEGRVVDPEGRPMADVDVFAVHPKRGMAWRTSVYPELGSHSVRTGKDGRYVLPRVAAGRNTVYARPSWWPNMLTRDNSVKVLARAGMRTQAGDIAVRPLEQASIDVEVLDERGQPVFAASAGFAHVAFARSTDRDGRVRLYEHARHGAAGPPHHLYVRADGFVPHVQPVDPRKDDEVRVTLKRGRTVAGTVAWADGAPAPGVGVWAVPPGGNLDDGAYVPHPAHNNLPPLLWYGYSMTSATGGFEIDEVPAESELLVLANGRWLRFDANDGIRIVLDAPAPEAPTGEVVGTVHDARTGRPILRAGRGVAFGEHVGSGEVPGRPHRQGRMAFAGPGQGLRAFRRARARGRLGRGEIEADSVAARARARQRAARRRAAHLLPERVRRGVGARPARGRRHLRPEEHLSRALASVPADEAGAGRGGAGPSGDCRRGRRCRARRHARCGRRGSDDDPLEDAAALPRGGVHHH